MQKRLEAYPAAQQTSIALDLTAQAKEAYAACAAQVQGIAAFEAKQ